MKRHLPLAFGIFSALHALSAAAQPVESPLGVTSPSFTGHVVSPGDNLEKIARQLGCRVSDLMTVNGLQADSVIYPGQKLQPPGPPAQESATQEPVPPAPEVAPLPSVEATHKVASGETFAAIARQHDIPLKDLLAANPDIKPTALRPGQTIRLGQASSPTKDLSLEAGTSQMILATKQDGPVAAASSSPKPLVSPPAVKIRSIRIDRQMTYLEFASRQGTNTRRLNQLNGLDLLDSALLARGTELLAPVQP